MEVDIGGMSVNEKKYLAKIIAKNLEDLKVISALSAGATMRISDIKYLKSNQIFLLSMKRIRKKFKKVDPEFSAIETRYGSGYRWNVS